MRNLPNGKPYNFTYNTRLQPNEIKLGTSGSPTSVLDLTYSYGTTTNNGNVQSIGYSGGGLSYTQSFGYDALNRLTTSSESGSAWSQTNGYDQYSNRWIDYGGGVHNLAFSASNNRITSSGYSYDAAGNLTNDTVHAYTFDAENKINKVDTVAAYVYDGEGQRVRKLLGENTRFVYGIGGALIAEFDSSSGSLKKEYVYGGASTITIEPTAVNSNGTRYTTADTLGSPRVITNSVAAVVSRHDYMPFGEELFAGTGGRTVAQGYSGGDGVRQHFTQYERDVESSLDYAHARNYSSTQGRFTGADIPLMDQYKTEPQSWNLYAYVGNKPLTYTDPFGLWKRREDCEGNSPKCYESDRKDDTYKSLAKILHVNARDLANLGPTEQPSDMENSKYQFDVFLSYSRKDEAFGRRLEDALENYTLPKDVNSRLISRKRLNVFRDKKDLVPSDADYFKTIAGYLNRSQYLVVICSPNARASDYVNDEIKTFLKSNEASRLIPVLLSGKPNNDSQAKPEEYAFPQALCDALAMPLAVAFTEFASAPGKLNKGRYHDSWYTLLAKIFGTERAEIERLDAKRKARRRAIFAGVSLAVIAALSVALVFAIISRQQAASERDHAQQLLYASDMNVAQRAYQVANVGLGRQLLESHRPKSGEIDLRGFEWYYLWNLYNEHLASFESTDDLAFSRDGSRFATVTSDGIKIWDTASRHETATIALGPVPAGSNSDANFGEAMDLSPDGNTIAYNGTERGTLLLDIASGSSRKIPFPVLGEKQKQSSVLDTEEGIQRFWQLVRGGTPRFSPDGRLIALDYGCGVVAVLNAKSLVQVVTLGEGPPASGCAEFVTFSADGRILAYGDSYGVGLWDTVSQKDLRGPGDEDADVADSIAQLESVAISPDNRMLAIGDRSQQIVLWNISTRKVIGRLKGHEGWVSALAFSPDGKTLYSGGLDQTVKLWDLSSYQTANGINGENMKPFATFKGHTGLISAIKCAADGKTVATVSRDHTVKLWAITAGREFEKIDDVAGLFPKAYLAVTSIGEGEVNKITPLDLRPESQPVRVKIDQMPSLVSPDRKVFAFEGGLFSGIESRSMDLVEAESGQKVASIPMRFLRSFASFSQDSRLFGVIGRDRKSVMLWDAVQKKDLPAIKNDVELRSYLFSPDGKMIVTFDNATGTVKSWDIASQRVVAQLARNKQPAAPNAITPDEDDPQALSPDGRFLAFSDSTKVELWQVNSSDAPLIFANDVMRGLVSVVAFSPDGKFLAAGDESGMVRIWDVVKRRELATFIGHKDVVTTLAFTPDSRTLASGGGARDAAVKVYGMPAMRELLTLTHEPSPTAEVHAGQGSEDAILQLFFSADGKALTTYSGNSILRTWRGSVPQS